MWKRILLVFSWRIQKKTNQSINQSKSKSLRRILVPQVDSDCPGCSCCVVSTIVCENNVSIWSSRLWALEIWIFLLNQCQWKKNQNNNLHFCTSSMLLVISHCAPPPPIRSTTSQMRQKTKCSCVWTTWTTSHTCTSRTRKACPSLCPWRMFCTTVLRAPAAKR